MKEIPKDMFNRPIIVGDFVAKAVNIPKVRILIYKVTKVRGRFAYINNSNQPINKTCNYIVVTDLIHNGNSSGISE